LIAAISIWVFATEAKAEDWQFQVTPYLWAAGIEGDIATLPGLPEASIDLSFSDVIENFKIGGMLVAEARKGRFGIFMDVIYIDVEPKGSTPGPLFSSVKIDSETFVFTGAGLYRIWEEGGAFVDLLAGARVWSIDTKLSLGAGILSAVDISHKETWVDPVIGTKGLLPIANTKFYLSAFGLIGGFDVSSDFLYDVGVNLGYSWTENFATTIGYRRFDVDYKEGDFLYDVAQSGMTLGFSWRF